MARTKQKLINFHSSGETNVPLNQLEYGEIAVRHIAEPGKSELIIKTSDNTSAVFVESGKVQTMINDGVAGVTTNVTHLAESLSAVSATAVSAATALADEIVSNGNFHAEVRDNLSGHVATLTNNLANNYYTKTEVDNKLTERDTLITGLRTDLTGLSGATSAFSASVVENYALSADVVTEIGVASGAAVASANTYTDDKLKGYYTSGQVDNLLNEINTETSNLETSLEQLSGVTSAFSASVVDNYALSADVVTEIGVASGAAVASANTYTDDKLKGYYTSGQVDTKLSQRDTLITGLRTDLTGLSGATSAFSATVQTMSASVKSYIDDRLTTVYKFKGTKATYDQLPSDADNGDVWNVTSAIGEPGQEGYIPAGTNFAWDEDESRWDALGGTIDLSGFATKEELEEIDTQAGNLETSLEQLSGVTSAFSASVVDNYALSADVVTEIGVASGAAVTSAINYTNTTLQGYYTSGQVDTKLSQRDTLITGLRTDLTGLSGATSAFSASVVENYALSADVVTEIGVASGSAVTSANTYTDNKLKGYYTSGQVDNLLNTINTSTGDINTNLTDLSGVTSALSATVQTIESTANSALQGYQLTGDGTTTSGTQTIQSGAKADYTAGGIATLDLSEFIIDCGDW